MKSVKLFVILLIILSGQCKQDNRETILVSGSETMHVMMDAVAKEFMKRNAGYNVVVKGGGSFRGIHALMENKTDLAISSRELSEDELNRLQYVKKDLEVVVVAYDGIAIVVNPQNVAGEIHLRDLADVFSGKITNWKQLGGRDVPVKVVIRNDNSGTSMFFKTYVLREKYLGDKEFTKNSKKEYTLAAKIVSDNYEMSDYIKENPGAIGYMGMGSAAIENKTKVKVLKFSRGKNGDYILPSPASVFKREYKLNRALYMIYKPDQGFKIDAFASFVLSKEGQTAILNSGYLKSTMKQIEVKTYVED